MDKDNIIVRDIKAVAPTIIFLSKELVMAVWFLIKLFVPLFVVGFILFFAYDIIKVVVFLMFWALWWGKVIMDELE